MESNVKCPRVSSVDCFCFTVPSTSSTYYVLIDKINELHEGTKVTCLLLLRDGNNMSNEGASIYKKDNNCQDD